MTRPANPQLVAALVGTASDLIAEKGPDGVTLKEVAGRLGVTTTTVHYYFGDRDGLMAAVRVAAVETLAAALTVVGAAHATAPAQLRATGRAFADWAREGSHRYALMFAVTSAGSAETGALSDEPPDARRILHARLREILERGRRRGELTFAEAETQASLALCWLAGVAVVTSTPFVPAEQETGVEALLDGALAALLAPISSVKADAWPAARQTAEVTEIRPRRPAETHELSDDELDQVAAAGLQEGSARDFLHGSP